MINKLLSKTFMKLSGFYLAMYVLHYLTLKIIALNYSFGFLDTTLCLISATLFISLIIRAYQAEQAKKLNLQKEILRAIHQLIIQLNQVTNSNFATHLSEAIIQKACDNIHLFTPETTQIIYTLAEALTLKKPGLFTQADSQLTYLQNEIDNLTQLTSLANFMLSGIIQPVFISLPLELWDNLIARASKK